MYCALSKGDDNVLKASFITDDWEAAKLCSFCVKVRLCLLENVEFVTYFALPRPGIGMTDSLCLKKLLLQVPDIDFKEILARIRDPEDVIVC